MKAIVANEASPSLDALNIELVDKAIPSPGSDQCLVEIHGASVNASDVKGLLGTMHKLIWPRTPGRDYAGRVVDGPKDMVGKDVWGSGADLGMGRDGAHAQYMVVEAASIRQKPDNLTMLDAAGVGVPFCTAQIGLIDYAQLKEGETVLVMGLNGKVGQAVTQIATRRGARVIGVERRRDDYIGHTNGPVDVINSSKVDVAGTVMELTNGQGADIAFNTVGDPYLNLATDCLRQRGRQVVIAAFQKEVPFNLIGFYRKRLQLLGMASMGFDAIDLAKVFDQLYDGFAGGDLKPFAVEPNAVFTLQDAAAAYATAASDDTRSRIFIDPKA